mgnify:CR=1 FL=1
MYNVQSMKYDTPQSEAYNRMTLDGMPLSKHKLDAIKASMTEDEDMVSYLIPFLRYHSRWSELTDADLSTPPPRPRDDRRLPHARGR